MANLKAGPLLAEVDVIDLDQLPSYFHLQILTSANTFKVALFLGKQFRVLICLLQPDSVPILHTSINTWIETQPCPKNSNYIEPSCSHPLQIHPQSNPSPSHPPHHLKEQLSSASSQPQSSPTPTKSFNRATRETTPTLCPWYPAQAAVSPAWLPSPRMPYVSNRVISSG